MKDFSQYTEIGRTTNTVVYIAQADPDILIVVPREGTLDHADDARGNVAFYQAYARSLGRPCGSVVIMTNMVGQDAEARRAYQEIDPKLFFAAAFVVENALSRALGSFFIGLSRPNMPTRLFDNIHRAIEWIKTVRPKNLEGDSHGG